MSVCVPFLQREFVPSPPSDDSREHAKEHHSVLCRSNNKIREHQPFDRHTCPGKHREGRAFLSLLMMFGWTEEFKAESINK